MKHTLTVACILLRSAWQAGCRPFSDQFRRLSTLRSGSLRLALTALLLAPPALPADESITNSIGMKLVRIDPGTFTMGQDGPPMEDYMGQKRLGVMYKDFDRIDFDEKPAHQVTITQPFHIGVTEVTVAQYWQFDPGFKTSDAKSNPLYPRPSGGAGAIGAQRRWTERSEVKRVEKGNPYQ
ncbi:MAG: SUMF1/EgtB/PvdO family nonheme iron enzyme [Verrucomicrobiales bacterium]|nr:SUMF1/EgtB/PvdO family nonheme iron enzyme [Verrucomicrobiales bacterium]MDP4848990.1 SUMF1/EgtB/PvdO family nonheme iron enzyme [Verrucomicrobiales bacterium]